MQECFGRNKHPTVPRPPGNPKDQKITGRGVIHLLPAVKQATFDRSRYAGLVVGIGVVGGIARQLQAEYLGIDEAAKAPAVKSGCAFAAVVGEWKPDIRFAPCGDHMKSPALLDGKKFCPGTC